MSLFIHHISFIIWPTGQRSCHWHCEEVMAPLSTMKKCHFNIFLPISDFKRTHIRAMMVFGTNSNKLLQEISTENGYYLFCTKFVFSYNWRQKLFKFLILGMRLVVNSLITSVGNPYLKWETLATKYHIDSITYFVANIFEDKTLHFVLQRRTQLPHEKIQLLEYQSI